MDKRIILYLIAGLLVLALLVLTFFPGIITAWKDSGAEGEDKCNPPVGGGYTEESWIEHMSHYPNIYAECLT